MATEIKIPTNVILVKIRHAWEANLDKLASEIRENCNEYCKERSGELIASSFRHSDLPRGQIVWKTPYAARQYWEIETAFKTKNPKATWHWCDVAKAQYMKEWEAKAQQLFDEGMRSGR